ncbi:Hypothetical protein NTJ_05152 [Nesidiocoris tenuis]|nr:Hypothetical protein NTJ_05152 [Nesidiocoris tenuis]
MIGSSMALALGKSPLFTDRKIALVEAGPKKVRKNDSEQYSNRVSAINPSSKRLFHELGVWKRFRRYQTVKDMRVWGSYTADTINYAQGSDSDDDIAYIIENDEIVDAVMEELNGCSNVDVFYKSNLNKVDMGPKSVNVQINSEQSCECKLLIGADGANSQVRKIMDTNYLSYGYDQTAIVATLNIMEKQNNTAWQRFLPTGPIALLPLNSTTCSLVWSTSHDEAKVLLSLTPHGFVDAINNAFNSKPVEDGTVTFLKNLLPSFSSHPKFLNECPQVIREIESSRAAFPLGFGHATNYVKPNVALIGDSAHRVHPLAGQGVNLGFRDVENLTKSLSQGLQSGRELSEYAILKQYEQLSQRANLPIMIAIDLIYRVYTSNIGLVRALGSLGIHLTETVAPIKMTMRQVASS